MIAAKFVRSTDGEVTVMLGFSHENLDRLRNGEPIVLDTATIAAAEHNIAQLIFFSGRTEEEMRAEFEKRGLTP